MSQIYSMDSATKQDLLGNPTNDILTRYLDSVGDGSGTKNMATTTDEYYLKPASGYLYVVDRVHITIEDDATLNGDGFGGIAALTTGCLMKIQRVGTSQTNDVNDLLNAVPIKSHAELGAIGRMSIINEAAGCVIECDIDYKGHGAPLRISGDKGERLFFHVQDNLSGLNKMYVTAIGRVFIDES